MQQNLLITELGEDEFKFITAVCDIPIGENIRRIHDRQNEASDRIISSQ